MENLVINKRREVIQVDRELISNLSNLIKDQASQNILGIFADIHPADIAEIINHLDADDASYAFSILDTETAGEVVTELDENLRDKILSRFDAKTITDIIDELDTDDATDIVSTLPEPLAEHVLENIDEEDSADVKELLKYPEDSAGGIMSSDFVYVSDKANVKDAIRQVRLNAEDFENIYHIYVLKQDDTLVGVVGLKALLINPLKKRVIDIMKEDLIYVSPYDDQEEVAEVMDKYDLVSIPVVNENKKMLGRITVDDVIDVINEEATEDIQKIAGLSEEQESSDSVFRITRIRLPWLIIALVMEFLAAMLLSSYEEFIRQFYIATFFIPVVMAMGGSSGTQAAIVMVRAIGTRDVWLADNLRKLFKEFLVSLLNGLACGALLLLGTVLVFNDTVSVNFSIILSIALLVIIVFATMVGASIPLFLRKLGTDPAIATGPFVTTTNDILGLLIYLSFISIFYFS
ncbi:MAG: magnesium transporter MgtE [Melioribacteraceae bacterium]|nr:MAG: magnesium transporter MgtE [Melioribacteraceae bacterium]